MSIMDNVAAERLWLHTQAHLNEKADKKAVKEQLQNILQDVPQIVKNNFPGGVGYAEKAFEPVTWDCVVDGHETAMDGMYVKISDEYIPIADKSQLGGLGMKTAAGEQILSVDRIAVMIVEHYWGLGDYAICTDGTADFGGTVLSKGLWVMNMPAMDPDIGLTGMTVLPGEIIGTINRKYLPGKVVGILPALPDSTGTYFLDNADAVIQAIKDERDPYLYYYDEANNKHYYYHLNKAYRSSNYYDYAVFVCINISGDSLEVRTCELNYSNKRVTGKIYTMVGDTSVAAQITEALDNHEVSWNELTDKPFYEESIERVVLSSTQLTTVQTQGNLNVFFPEGSDYTLTVGQEYIVTWNGVEYRCIAQIFNEMPFFGNLAISGQGDDTGEPFIIIISDGIMAVYGNDGNTSPTLKVTTIEKSVKTLDLMYMPEHEHSYVHYRWVDYMVTEDVDEDDNIIYRSMAYGNGKFVTVGDNPAYSEDGINWTNLTLPNSLGYYSITYGNGKFVAVDWGSDKACYSEDGINWFESTLPKSSTWSCVTYGNGKFVAVSRENSMYNNIAHSEDGITWLPSNSPNSYSIRSVAYGNGKFIALTYQDYKRRGLYSEDGISWIEFNLPVDCYYNQSITYGDDKFVLVGCYGSKTAYSEDGINWTVTESRDRYGFVTYANGLFIAIPYDPNNTTSTEFSYSKDGINWSESILPKVGSVWTVAYGNNRFVTILNNGKVLISYDGIKWIDGYDELTQDSENIDVEKMILNTIARTSQLVQSDWSQNDETAADYIKNRPFYTGDTVEEVLLAETTVEIGSDLYVTLPSAVVLEEGKTYIVTLNETQYECTAGVLSNGTTMVGNDSFKFGTNRDNTQSMLQVTTEGSYTISVTQCVTPVFKLDAKYLPDHLPNENPVEILPETTFTMDSNNGYFDLRGMFAGSYNKGDVCTVIFDGIKYECTAYIEDSEMSYTALGSFDEGYPFEVYSHYVAVRDLDQHTIRIINRNVKKLDNKFLDINTTDNIMDAEDDDVPTVKAVMDELNGFAGWVDSELSKIPALPEITSADNGKVLMVVNGKLQLVSLNLSVDANGVITVQ